MHKYKTVSNSKIMEYFEKNRDKLVKASDIDAYLHSEGMDVNSSTIYRCLNKLSADGTIIKYVASKGEMSSFQYIGDNGRNCREHLHLRCVRCDRIIHLECSFMQEISGHIMEHHGFKLICESSVLYGVCKECSDKQ